MSKARDLANLLADGSIGSAEIANGAVIADKLASGASLANLADGSISAAKFASGAAASNIGYKPALYAYGSFDATTSGNVWCRCVSFPQSRAGYLVTVNTNGGYYSPTSHSFVVFKTWSNEIYAQNLFTASGRYVTSVRMQGNAADGPWFLEVLFPIHPDQTGGAFRVGVMALAHDDNSFLPQVGSYGTNAANLASVSNNVAV